MEAFAILKNVPMSAQKMREVVRQVQGLGALEAMAVLQIVPRKGARLVSKVLRSAIANAENNKNLKPETLRVKEAVAGTATTLKRFNPRRAVRRVRSSNAVATLKSPFRTNNQYGPKNKSNRFARRSQQRLALEVVCQQKRIWRAADRRPQNPRLSQERSSKARRCRKF